MPTKCAACCAAMATCSACALRAPSASESGRRLQAVERHTRVPPGVFEQGVERVGTDPSADLCHATLDHLLQVGTLERLEPEDATTREQGGNDLERWVF